MTATMERPEVRRIPEPDPVEQISKLPSDMAIVKLENEQMFAMAAARPRDHAMILADIKGQLRTYKTFAQTATYAKPVGKDESGRMKYATGLSVRAAEAIAEAYGYNRCRIDVEDLDGGDKVQLTASFVDYQKCRTWQTSSIVSKTYKGRGGQIQRHNDDRFYNVVVKAEASKAIREAILRSVPPGLRSDLEECVNEQLDAFLDDSTQKKLVAQFSKKGVTQDQLETLLDKRLASFDQDDRRQLLQIWNAIEQGESTVATVFGGEEEAAPAIKRPQAKEKDSEPKAEEKPAAPLMADIIAIVESLTKVKACRDVLYAGIGVKSSANPGTIVEPAALKLTEAIKKDVLGYPEEDRPSGVEMWQATVVKVKEELAK